MFKIMAFLAKRDGLDTQAFIDYYENHHLPLISRLAPVPVVYKRNYLLPDDPAGSGTVDFDVVTELVFADRAAYLAWGVAVGTGEAGAQVVADELRFLDRSRTRSYVVEEYLTSE
jgi:hypothetical protein